MDLAVITLNQVIILFVLMAVGIICNRLNILNAEAKRILSGLLMKVIVPCMIINSYVAEFNLEILHNLIFTFVLSFILIMTGFVITFFVTIRINKDSRDLIRFATIYSNAAFMGFPLIQALFGSKGLLYASAYVTVFNLLLWTQGVIMVSGSANLKQSAKNLLSTPVLFAVALGLIIYLCRIPIPALILNPLQLIGNMNTPISMFITGMIISENKLLEFIKAPYVWLATVLRLLMIPVICFVLAYALKLSGMHSQVALLLEAAPCASITSVFAVQYHRNEKLAAGMVVISTLLSIITLPVCAYIMTFLVR